MARTKYHITPESGRLSITLNKRQLKEFKKMSIDDILQVAVESFIKKYNNISFEQMDEKGINTVLDE